MTSFLTKTYSINLSGVVILLVGLAFGFLFVFALLSFVSGYKKYLTGKKNIRTGFLGKPLMQFGAFAIIAGGIVGAVYLTTQTEQIDVNIEAKKEMDMKFSYEIVDTTAQRRLLELEVIPVVDSEEWSGDDEVKFDIIWNIKPDSETKKKGQKQVDFFETDRSFFNPSKVTAELQSGNYSVEILMSFEEEVYEKVFELNID